MKPKRAQLSTRAKEQLTTFQSICEDFLISQRALERAPSTLRFYQFHANLIITWLESQGLRYIDDITSAVVSQFMLYLSENGYIESFNGKLRDELLNGEIFNSLKEAKMIIELWRKEYNTVRPHSTLHYRPPVLEAVLMPQLAPPLLDALPETTP